MPATVASILVGSGLRNGVMTGPYYYGGRVGASVV